MLRRSLQLLLPLVAACSGGDRTARDQPAERGTIVAFNAGSLARPLRAALDTFARRHDVTVQQENAGSLETARKLTELGKVPDVIALADHEVFPQLLLPEHVGWYVEFARNRMVIAYTERSRHADEITGDNWYQVLARPGVEVGRADPNLDPNGYRTLLTLQLAERHYRQPGLYRRLLAAAPPRNVRPKEADLVGLLQAGELDYIWSYESIAQAAGLRFVRLPSAIDLGDPADSAFYVGAVVRVTGHTPRDTVEFRGAPIVYALSIPRRAPHPDLAARFVAFLLSEDGKRVLRQARLDALDRPVLVGSGAPPVVTAAVGGTP
jgi:molybdate/tungstate transport system substrate-binding protein